MANVTLKGVYKFYENSDTPAVKDFNLEINDKEFVVFVGPSGCGKSTTLRMIAGLEEITYGDVIIGDRKVNDVEPKDRNIAMVFQNYALYPHMTVYENMAYSLKLAKPPKEERDESKIIALDKNGKKLNFFTRLFARTRLEERDSLGNIVYNEDGTPKFAIKKNKDGTPKLDKNGNVIYKTRPYTIDEYAGPVITDENGNPKLIAKTNKDGSVKTNKNGETVYKTRKYTKSEIAEKVWAAARTLDITDYLERKPSQLSGGQRQRVAIGRSIVRNPKVFLFDEPLSNLDAKLRNQMRSEILLLRKKINTTFIYVTHDQVEAMTLGDKIVIMKFGVIQQVGSPSELFNHPANLFVAGFIGTPQMNYFDAKLVKNKGNYVVELYGKKFALENKVNAYLKKVDYPEKEITLGIRPEHITPECEGNASVIKFMSEKLAVDGQLSMINSKISVSEMMGSELYVHTETEDGKLIILRIPTLSLSKNDRQNIDNGGEIKFTFSPQVMHLFDKETEENIIPLEAVQE